MSFRELRYIFGEAKDEGGPDVSGRQPWSGFMVPLPQGSSSLSDPGFPWATATARKVWDTVKTLLKDKDAQQLSELTPLGVIRQAVSDVGAHSFEMTPEDLSMMELAVYWKLCSKNSEVPVKNPNRLGGAPGGPFRSVGDGHFLVGKGAP